MSIGRRRPAARSSAVLLLSRETAEWFERASDGSALYAAEAVLGPSPDDLVRAAVAARRSAGSRSAQCVVALSTGLVEQRTFPLPDLSRNDLIKVLPRKAASLLDSSPEETLFAALPFAREQRQGADIAQEQKWYLVAMRRGFTTDLSLALRREHFEILRVVDAPLARLCSADAVRGAHEEACIVIDVQRDDVYVSLISHAALRMQNRIRGSFDSVPTMALSLIQETKSFDAFWRKVSRGQSVSQVVVIGLESERGRLFSNAIAAAIADVRVTQLCDGEPWHDADGKHPVGRMASVAACAADGPFLLDLTVSLPARGSRIVALATVLVTATVGAGALAHDGISQSLESVLEDKRRLEGQALELETLRDANERSARALHRAVSEGERLIAAGSLGVPLASLLEEALDVIGQDGEMTSFSARRTSSGGRMTIAGEIDPDPLRSTRALEGMRQQLVESRWFESVQIEAPAIARRESGASEASLPMEFELHANWRRNAP